MRNELKKNPFVQPALLKKVLKIKENKPTNKKKRKRKQEQIKTWSRSSTIMPEFVGLTFLVHNGKDFTTVEVSEEMVGYKFGEFSITRKRGKDARTK